MHPISYLCHLMAAAASPATMMNDPIMMSVSSLHRYAVKGLSGDALRQVMLQKGETFPDDRRYALLLKSKDWTEGEWLHKENFLCAFSDPEFLAQFQSSYEIVPSNNNNADNDDSQPMVPQRLLTLTRRSTGERLLDRIDLQDESNRQQLASLLSQESNKPVTCVTSASKTSHTHQFGNTSSGYKQRNDTRTIHIINQATIDDLQQTLGLPMLRATRFRPNLVVQGAPAWSEFDWVGTKQLVEASSGLILTVISKTVRCKGVSVDPDDVDPLASTLDIPKLLTQHYPQFGPYLGVYAVVDAPGMLQVGSVLTLQDK